MLNRSRQKQADQIFTAGAGEAVSGGSLDAAMLHEAVASLEGEEYAKALASLEGAREEGIFARTHLMLPWLCALAPWLFRHPA